MNVLVAVMDRSITMKNIEDILRECVGHRVTITFCSVDEPKLREVSGILVQVEEQVITFKLFDNYGGSDLYHLNRHSCTLHSVIDEGK